MNAPRKLIPWKALMIRRHLTTIAFLAFLIAAGSAYGFLLALGLAQFAPRWLTIVGALVGGTVIAVLSDVTAEAVGRWYDERQTVKAFIRTHKETGR